jgi:hypothetical protein
MIAVKNLACMIPINSSDLPPKKNILISFTFEIHDNSAWYKREYGKRYIFDNIYFNSIIKRILLFVCPKMAMPINTKLAETFLFIDKMSFNSLWILTITL